ncbi:unnamed protein product [Pocillopora meandrina]|uniref:Uncharacterized protein n=1 Tax=Pocillopora meandrina TaxID=46732 RepID=A0AAU9VNW9_9CNID|nr:unnamed protein product [Pocillopora meandrina]
MTLVLGYYRKKNKLMISVLFLRRTPASMMSFLKMKECRTQVLVYQNNSGVGDQIRLIFVETTVQQSAEITASSKNKRHNGIRVLYNFQPLKVFCGTFAVQNGFKHNNHCFPTSNQTRHICMANMIPPQPRLASIVRRTPPTIPVKRKEKLKSVPTQA